MLDLDEIDQDVPLKEKKKNCRNEINLKDIT